MPANATPIPVPVLSRVERRFFKVVQTKNLIGSAMFLTGIGILVGWFFTDKVHGVEKVALIASILLMILGAHLLSSDPTEKALGAIGRTAARLLPFSRKSDTDTHAKPEGQ